MQNANTQQLDALTREGVLLSVNVRYWWAQKKRKRPANPIFRNLSASGILPA